ncbi:HK97 family phage prohead protease [Rhodoplanes sp. SY1]|uniref:HK97 family phage prohead protease n=1 Tax=Rhodoplanes sp. SY1 TaxID=3166646 RepID=UPI0038B5F4EE
MTEAERLSFPIALKFAPGAEQGELVGYASTFGGMPDGHGDLVAPGAYTKSLAEHRAADTMPAMLWSHDQSQPLGRWLSAVEDDVGLKMTGRLTLDVPRAREAYALAKDGALGLSIGYRAREAERTRQGNRLLKSVALFEVSLVAMPSNTSARIISVKSAFDVATINDPRSFEEFLREAGFPRAFAKAATARGFKAAAGQRDADGADPGLARDLRAAAGCDRQARVALRARSLLVEAARSVRRI